MQGKEMPDLQVEFPLHEEDLPQDEEYCLVRENGQIRRIRFHDYDEIYSIPGLYEHIFYDKLRCNSPEVVTSLLAEGVEDTEDDIEDMVVLDLGAGNGMVGEALVDRGVNGVIGVDIIEEAAAAAFRDRPDVYDDYLVEDFRQIDDWVEERIADNDPNCLMCVAALGFDDIPSVAFANGFNMIADEGWIAFNIKNDIIEGGTGSGFSRLIRNMITEGALRPVLRKTYQHRLSIDGTPLYYQAMVGIKCSEVNEEMMPR